MMLFVERDTFIVVGPDASGRYAVDEFSHVPASPFLVRLIVWLPLSPLYPPLSIIPSYRGVIVTDTAVTLFGTLFIVTFSIIITFRDNVSVRVFSSPNARLMLLVAVIRSACCMPSFSDITVSLVASSFSGRLYVAASAPAMAYTP